MLGLSRLNDDAWMRRVAMATRQRQHQQPSAVSGRMTAAAATVRRSLRL